MKIRAGLLVMALLVIACGSSDGQADAASAAATTEAPTPATTAAPTTTTTAPATTTEPPTTTTTRALGDTEGLFATPEVMEDLAMIYCSSWPVVGEWLSAEPRFVAVPADGWDPERDQTVKGLDEVVPALAATEVDAVECATPGLISGDWIVLPVSASRPDGSGQEGMWALRITKSGAVEWHLAYMTEVEQVSPATHEPDPVLAAEARDFCAIVEGKKSRDADKVLAAMTGDPAAHNIGNEFAYIGTDGIREMIRWYPRALMITCEEPTLTHGEWSAAGSTLSEDPIFLVGATIQQHIDGKIHRQYFHWTQTSGRATWGLRLSDG